jgi:small subunit ribosomal protein S24e
VSTLELKILEERPNPLLKRVEYRFEVIHPMAATPTRDEVRVEFAKAANVPKDRVVIERMNAKFGTAKTIGEAAAYESKQAAELIAREHILVRNGIKEKKVKAVPGAASETPEPAAPAPAAPAAKGA